MSVVIWRWASEFAGLPFSEDEYLAGALEEGSGYTHGTYDGRGLGDGTWSDVADEDSAEYDTFDFRTGEWRYQ